MKYTLLLSLATAFVAFTVSSHANRLSEEVFSVQSVSNTYPVMSANSFNGSAYDIDPNDAPDIGDGSAWNSGLTSNLLTNTGELNFADFGQQRTVTNNNTGAVKTTSYLGPKVYMGITRDHWSAQQGIHNSYGNGYRLRFNNVSAGSHTSNGGDILARTIFMFDVGAQTGVAATGNPGEAGYVAATPNYVAPITLDVGDSWEFRRNDNIYAQLAVPAHMGNHGSVLTGNQANQTQNDRASLANYRPIVKANGEYYAGPLHTVDLSSFATDGNAQGSTRLFNLTIDASSTIWTKMVDVENSSTRYHTQSNPATNLIVDTSAPELAVADTTSTPGITKTFTAGATTVIGTDLTNIDKVGFLLEAASQQQNGGFNYGVKEFTAKATRASTIETGIGVIPWSEDFEPAVTLNTGPTDLDWGDWHVSGQGLTDPNAENSSITTHPTLNYPILQAEKNGSANAGAVILNAIGFGTAEPRFTSPDDYEATYVFDLVENRYTQADLQIRSRGSDGFVQLVFSPNGVVKFTHWAADYQHTTFDDFNGPSKFRKTNDPTSANNGISITSGGTFDPSSSDPVIVTISPPVDSLGTPIGDDPLTTGPVQDQDGGDYAVTAEDITNGIVTIGSGVSAVFYSVPVDATVGDTLEAVETDGLTATATATVNMNVAIPQEGEVGDDDYAPAIPANSYVESVTIENVGYNYVDEPTVTFSGGGMTVEPEYTFTFQTGDRQKLAAGAPNSYNSNDRRSTQNVIREDIPNGGSIFTDGKTLTIVQSYDSATDTITYYYGTDDNPVNNVALVANPAEHSAGGYGFHDVISGNPNSTPAANDMAISIQYSQWGVNSNNTAQVGTPASSDYQAQVGTPASEDYQPQVGELGDSDYQPQVGTPASPDYQAQVGTPASDDYQAAVTYIPTIGFKSYALEFGTGIDADGDGILDRLDAFPDDSTETVDTDGDGFGDNSDEHNGQDDTIINNSLGLTSGEGKINLTEWLQSNNYTVDDGGPSLVDHNVVVGDLATANASLAAANASLATTQSDLTTAQGLLDNAKEARPGSTVIDVANDVATITLTVEQTSDVGDWTNATSSDHDIQLSAPAGSSFYRFTYPDE